MQDLTNMCNRMNLGYFPYGYYRRGEDDEPIGSNRPVTRYKTVPMSDIHISEYPKGFSVTDVKTTAENRDIINRNLNTVWDMDFNT